LYLLLIPNVINTEKSLNGLFRVLSLNGWILLLAGFITILLNQYQPGSRLRVLGMDLNEFGIKLLVTSTPFLWRLLETIDPTHKGQRSIFDLNVVFLMSAIILVAFSGSRGSAIAWFATLLSFAFWKPTRKYGILMIIFLLMAVLVAPSVFITLFERFSEASTFGGRLFIWKADWLLIQKYPIGGVGIGNAGFILATYTKLFTSIFRHMPQIVSHNAVLQIWVEVGLIGLLLYLGVLANALLMFFQRSRHIAQKDRHFLERYFAFVTAITLGVVLWWLQGGASEHDHVYFIVLALLVIPSHLEDSTNDIVISA
jgi:O-antigen ligase